MCCCITQKPHEPAEKQVAISADELLKLKHASKQQLQKVLEFIEEEIVEPEKPEPLEVTEDKKEKEN